MAKAGVDFLRKAENPDWILLGRALEYAQKQLRWSLKELAVALSKSADDPRDERQIARWIAGTERTQVEAIFAVQVLRAPFVVGLALEVDDLEVVMQIRSKRPA